jgi:hypothetical protein
MTTVLLVEKLGTIKPLKIKEYNEEDFYKKCGYKSSSNFKRQHTWNVKVNGTPYWVSLFAKTDVKNALGENKYEFPPPVDSVLYFGTCLLAAYTNNPNGMFTPQPISLSVELWNAMYNKLYGGFENLADTAESDENEYDELENVPSHKKTKEGYLKDGFVVDDKTKKVSSDASSTSSSSKSKKSPTTSVKNTTPNGSAKLTTNQKKDAGGNLPPSQSSKKDEGEDENENESVVAEDDDEENEDDSTVYTDIDEEDEEEDIMASGGAIGKKKKDAAGSSKKKGGTSKGESVSNTIEMTINELLITDELKEEPYIE